MGQHLGLWEIQRYSFIFNVTVVLNTRRAFASFKNPTEYHCGENSGNQTEVVKQRRTRISSMQKILSRFFFFLMHTAKLCAF